MLIKKASDIPSSEITPKELYLNRRKFIAGVGTLGAAYVAGRFISSASFSSATP
jgi:hypothetical protein